MVGTSNVNVGDSPLAVVAGVHAVISLLKTYLKNPKILILSLIPRDSGKPIDSVIMDVNKHLQKIVDIKKEKNVEYVDIAKKFLTPNGTVNFSLYTTDQINPNAAGQVLYSSLCHTIPGITFVIATK
jgi:lysophospholipase L1-like esterase